MDIPISADRKLLKVAETEQIAHCYSDFFGAARHASATAPKGL
jgi:hypothetical protein